MYIPSLTAIPFIVTLFWAATPTHSKLHEVLQYAGLSAYQSNYSLPFIVAAVIVGVLADEIRKRGFTEVVEKVREYLNGGVVILPQKDTPPNGMGSSTRLTAA